MSEDPGIEDALRRFIREELGDDASPAELRDTTPLITSGRLDSVATLTLVSFIEERFSVSLAAHEADVEHLNTIADMARLVRAKREGPA